mmetsp:Transcript_39835/g.95856  ORF Transcript_39835/g.95856 Transcript_39835/m.95856 type:complete len:1116 (+) Transcript_39835:87-3434(+)
MATPSSKLCSDPEWKVEVDADERMKRRAATASDAKVAKRIKTAKKANTKKSAAPSDAADRTANRKQGGKKKRSKSTKGASSSSSSSSKQSIKRVREQRRLQQSKDAENAAREEARKKARMSDLAMGDHSGNIIAALEGKGAAPEEFFWEMEAVIGRRIHRGRVEYLIRWKGCTEDDNTWEPAANLCDTAIEEAMKYTKEQKRKESQREADEKKLFGSLDDTVDDNDGSCKVGDVSMQDAEEVVVIDDGPKVNAASKTNDTMAVDSENPVVDDHIWKWSDADQVIFRDIERVDVNDPNAAKIVTEARINGTPLVLVGHVGWANFAKRWLTEKKVAKKKATIGVTKNESNGMGEGGGANPISVDLPTDAAAGVGDERTSAPESMHGAKQDCNSTPEKAGAGETEAAGVDAMSEKEDSTQTIVDKKEPNVTNEEKSKMATNHSLSDDLLDLSKNYELDVKKMIKDIGGEDIPVIKRHYNEEKPIHGKIPAEKFLTTCWPTSDSEAVTNQQGKSTAKKQKNVSNLYLHQWQFPLSDTAGRKLCHHNKPLPKGIMGEDLLKYWLDLPQCKLDSPLQYIFMGREDTLSKLHRDPGGLEISIAPIVGQKECVLVHRDDGSNCLYHLTASLEDIDLHRHPLLSQARTWRSVIQPGEILLMPYGTYHQCRNVTPCLSYSRFHLDNVNLLPFVQSLVNGDAPEIDHEEVLWNLTSELINRLDGVFDKIQSRVKAGLDEGDLIGGQVVETVNTLRSLRHFIREVARREEIRQIVKGSVQDSDATEKSQEHNFGMLVDDLDMCLHEFRYRQSKVVPPFKARRGKVLKNTLSKSSGRKDVIKRDMSKFLIGSKPVVAFNTSLENNYTSLVNADLQKHFPNASKDKVGETLISELIPGDKISVKLEQKHVKAEVIELLPQMKSAYLSFEDYPSVYDEYQPYELIRRPTGAEIPPDDVKPGLVVIDLSNSNEYRAKIQSIMNKPMARVKFFVSQHSMTRLVSPDMILGRYVPIRKRSKKSVVYESVEEEEEEVVPLISRPTKVGQIVNMGRRGAARVIKVHGEPVLTHVDVQFILGNVHSESMVPIETVELAPELDPESGRGRRQVASSSVKKTPAGSVVSPSATESSCD